MTLWLVRHAPVAVTGVCYGQHDVPVTLRPDQAAELVAGRWDALAHGVVPELWSSPWSRSRDVGEALARGGERAPRRRSPLGAFVRRREGRRFDNPSARTELGSRGGWAPSRSGPPARGNGRRSATETRRLGGGANRCARDGSCHHARRGDPHGALDGTRSHVCRRRRPTSRPPGPERLEFRDHESQFGVSRA